MVARTLLLSLVLLSSGAVGVGVLSAEAPEPGVAPPPPPPARAIPGISDEDRFPGGCVDCHVNRPDIPVDARISTLMARLTEGADGKLLAHAHAAAAPGVGLEGRHPAVPEALADIPAGCLTCHGRDSRAGLDFARMLHRVHLTGGDANHFMTLFQGECTHCHKLDAATGAWRIPSGPER